MKENDIVIHESFGIGIIVKIDKGTKQAYVCRVRFKDKSVKSVLSYFLTPLSDTFINFTASGLYKSMFSTVVYQRGVDYYRRGAVGQINFAQSPTVISATVSGSKKYLTQIMVGGTRVKTECSCPVGDHCKHAAALFCELQNDIKKLRTASLQMQGTSDSDEMSDDKKLDYLIANAFDLTKINTALTFISGLSQSYAGKAAVLLCKYAENGNLRNDRFGIANAAKKLPESKCLVSYLENRLNGWHNGYYSVFNEKSEISDADKKSILRYFTFSYNVSITGENYQIIYNMHSPSGAVAYRIIQEDDRSYKSVDYLCFWPDVLYGFVKKTVNQLYGKEMASDIQNIQAEIQKEIEERKVRELKESLQTLCQSLASRNVILNSMKKAEIEFCFEYTDSSTNQIYRGEGYMFLELRIGISRKYIIKDLLSFAGRFESSESFKYGKELNLTHCIENIAEKDQLALNTLFIMLSGMDSQNFVRGKRYLPLDNIGFFNLVKNLEDSVVRFNGDQYIVCCDSSALKVRIGKDYVISLSGPGENDILLDGGDKLILISNEERKIKIIDVKKDEKNLFLFAAEQSGKSLEPVLKDFKNEVFSRLYDSIETDESVSGDFTVSELSINAYFDYVKDKINVITSYEKNGIAFDVDSAESSVDRIKKENYLSYLKMLGFEDDVLSDSGDVLNFLMMDLTELKKYCNVYLSDSIKSKSVQTFRPGTVRIAYDNNIISAFIEESEYSDIELTGILKALKQKKKYVLLSGDRIVNLSGDDALNFEETVEDLGINKNDPFGSVQIPVSKALRAHARESGVRIDDYLSEMVEKISSFKSSDIPVPSLNADLRQYQEEGFKWLKTLSLYHTGGILADDMGLGKTLEIITLLKSDDAQKPSLVVCPKSLVFNWLNEFARFDPSAEVAEIYGPASVRQSIIENIDENKKVCYVTSYDSLRHDIQFYKKDLNYLILDEAQYIKNVNALKSRSVKSLKAEHRFALTGTPVENNVIDLWSIFDFIMPGYLDDLSEFKSEYTRDEEYTDRIAKSVAPFILRRTKSDVLKDLPEKFERIYSAEMTERQRQVYDACRLDAKKALEDGGKAFEILPYLMRLRQLCDDPSVLYDNYEGGSGKLEALSSILDEYLEAGHRILIFSQFVRVIEQIEKLLSLKKIRYMKITGETDSKDRIQMMNEFNENEDYSVFVISLKAGGTGLNLVGADTVIHFDPWWNVAAENQASDRAHRIGQTRNVEVIKLICDNSIEQNIIELQNVKKDLIDKLISDNDSSVTGISLDDIKFILKK